jgi:hypothetical protein
MRMKKTDEDVKRQYIAPALAKSWASLQRVTAARPTVSGDIT